MATEAVPSPGFWEQDGRDQYVGFEAGLADEIADEVGAARVRVVRVPFDDIVAGRLGSADLALSQATPTSEREESADFTSSYLEAPPGVLARAGIEARDAQGLQDLRWVVTDSSTLTCGRGRSHPSGRGAEGRGVDRRGARHAAGGEG